MTLSRQFKTKAMFGSLEGGLKKRKEEAKRIKSFGRGIL